MLHRQTVEGYQGTPAQLAEDIGNLRYDGLAELLRLLAEKIERDGLKDRARARPRLAAALLGAADQTAAAATNIEAAWRLSEPHMTGSDSVETEQ